MLTGGKDKISLAETVGYYSQNPEAIGNVTCEEFENWIKQVRGVSEMPPDLYEYVFEVSNKELREEFVKRILELKKKISPENALKNALSNITTNDTISANAVLDNNNGIKYVDDE